MRQGDQARRLGLAGLLIIGTIGWSGCGGGVARFGVVAAPGTGLAGLDLESRGDSVRVEGKSCDVTVLLTPFGEASVDHAVAEALLKSGGQVLSDVRVRTSSWTALLFSKFCYVVEATAWKIPGNAR